MAQVELPKGIIAIHGRLGNLIYRSRKQPDGTYKVFVHEAPTTVKQRQTTSNNFKHDIGPSSVQSRSNLGPFSRDKRK